MIAVVLSGGVAAAVAAEAPASVVALVLDTSGSLRPDDLDRTRGLAADLLASLPAGSEAAVFTFDDQPRLVTARTPDVDKVRRALDAARLGGRFTTLHDALYDASRYLREAPALRRALVLVTDGKDENSALHLEDALAAAQRGSIRVYAVGVGAVRERTLRRIAKLTGGAYLPAAEATGSLLASRILAAPGDAPAGGAGARAGPGGAVDARRSEAGSGLLRWLAVGAALSVAAVAGLLLRRRPPPLCPSCGRPLPDTFSPCRTCVAEPGSLPDAADSRAPTRRAAELPATVMARADLTEEYLEKTVTLREQPVLAVTGGPGSGSVFDVNREGPTSIGRAKLNDVVLQDVSVSSEHCRLRPENDHYVVHDLRSTNGTFVNERRVNRQALSEGDVIKVGETYLQFRLNQRRA